MTRAIGTLTLVFALGCASRSAPVQPENRGTAVGGAEQASTPRPPELEPGGPAKPDRSMEAFLTATWGGQYFYPGDELKGGMVVRSSVRFFAELTAGDGQLTGVIVEPNTFGSSTAPELRAELTGTYTPEGKLLFEKRYDGTGDVSHVVRYSGEIDRERLEIKGTWSSSETFAGTFIMVRQP